MKVALEIERERARGISLVSLRAQSGRRGIPALFGTFRKVASGALFVRPSELPRKGLSKRRISLTGLSLRVLHPILATFTSTIHHILTFVLSLCSIAAPPYLYGSDRNNAFVSQLTPSIQRWIQEQESLEKTYAGLSKEREGRRKEEERAAIRGTNVSRRRGPEGGKSLQRKSMQYPVQCVPFTAVKNKSNSSCSLFYPERIARNLWERPYGPDGKITFLFFSARQVPSMADRQDREKQRPPLEGS